MYINTFAGIRSVDPKLGELGQVLGLSRWELVWHVILPGALPQALTGLRLSVIASLLALVVGEQINANAGLGFMMNQAETFLAEERHRGGPDRVCAARRDRRLDSSGSLRERPWHGGKSSPYERDGSPDR